jgi:hypothetical protein
MFERRLSRNQLLRFFGAAGAVTFVGGAGRERLAGALDTLLPGTASAAPSAALACILSPAERELPRAVQLTRA